MSRRVYARTDIPRELRMVDHSGILSILLQWMERRRRDIELLLQKELYMLRRIWMARTGNTGFGEIRELPGFIDTSDFFPSLTRKEVLDFERRRLATNELPPIDLFTNLRAYAPGY